jgi:LysM repeat protein
MKQTLLSIVLLGTLVLAVFTGPDLWAAPGQEPNRQSVPTDTPPPSPLETETPTPTETPTSVPTATATPIPTSGPTSTPVPTTVPGAIICYHTVRRGETLFCIGRGYGVDPYAIAIRNSIVNPNLIYPGQVLAIPNAPRTLPSGPVCPPQCGGVTPVPATCRWYHTVVWGENLYRISLRYGVSMWAIAEANYIFNLNYIRAGQVLCIP